MSLSKQLILLITAIFTFVFIGNLYISGKNIKDYIEVETKTHMQDSATSLGLAIKPYMSDLKDPVIETMINSIYDMGYYKKIILLDVDRKLIYEKKDSKVFEKIPKWFINLFKIKSVKGESEIANAWVPSGKLIIYSNPGYAYLKLYKIVMEMFFYSLVVFIISLILTIMIVSFILKPLKEIEWLAIKIANGKFDKIKNIPWTQELKNVAIAMNKMSNKLEGIITNLNDKITDINKKANFDSLTALPTKSMFTTHLKDIFVDKRKAFVGILKIENLVKITSDFGNKKTDSIIIEISKVIKGIMNNSTVKIEVYRVLGSEIAFIAYTKDSSKIETILTKLNSSLSMISKKYKIFDLFHTGVIPFDELSTIEILQDRIYEAIEKSKIVGNNSHYINNDKSNSKSLMDWKKFLLNIISKSSFKAEYIHTLKSFNENDEELKEIFTSVKDEEGNAIPIGTFISIAEKYGKIEELDINVISQVVENIKSNKPNHKTIVNISSKSLESSTFKKEIFTILNKNKDSAKEMVFAITEYGAAKNIEEYKIFIDLLHRLGSSVMLKRYEARVINIEDLKNLNIDYLRLASKFSVHLYGDLIKKSFISTIVDISQILDIKTYVEYVEDKKDKQELKALQICGFCEKINKDL